MLNSISKGILLAFMCSLKKNLATQAKKLLTLLPSN